jgi:hypothetical protein
MIAGRRYDLALIDGMLRKVTGVPIATSADNHNTPALLLSKNLSAATILRRLVYPYPANRRSLSDFVAQQQHIIDITQSSTKKGTAAADQMELTLDSLAAEIAEAHRLFDLAMIRLGYKKE